MEKAATSEEATALKIALSKKLFQIEHANKKHLLISACVEGDIASAVTLLEPHVDVNDRDLEGNTPLILACRGDFLAIVELLLKVEKITIDAQNFTGKTALMYACKNGSKKIVALLLGKKAQTDIEDPEGNSAYTLTQAVAAGNPENKDDYREIIAMLRPASAAQLITPMTTMLSLAAATTLITKGPRFFTKRTPVYKDPLYLEFYATAFDEEQLRHHGALLTEVTSPILLLHHEPFMRGLGFDQKLTLLAVLRNYYRKKDLLRNSIELPALVTAIPHFKEAQQRALRELLEPYKDFEKSIFSFLSLKQREVKKTDTASLIACQKAYETDLGISTLGCCIEHMLCAAALERKTIVIWDAATGACIRIIHVPTKLSHLAWNRAGTHIAALSQTNEIYIISTDTEEIAFTITPSIEGALATASFNPQGTMVAAGTFKGEIVLIDIDKKTVQSVITPNQRSIRQIFFNDAHSLLMADENSLMLFDSVSNTWKELVKRSQKTQFFSDEKYYFALEGKTLTIHGSQGELVNSLSLNFSPLIACVARSRSIMAYLSPEGSLMILDAETETLPVQHATEIKRPVLTEIKHPVLIEIKQPVLIEFRDNGELMIVTAENQKKGFLWFY